MINSAKVMNEETIWNFLIKKGLTSAGAAGLMGNLYAESGFNPKNLQDVFERKLNLSDYTYTEKTDKGEYVDFIYDGAGFGLAQWTWWSRKKNLLDFSKTQGKSIGNLDMQLDFLYKELSTSYRNLLSFLCSTNDVREASNRVLLQYERPLDQSVGMQNARYNYAKRFYDRNNHTITKSTFSNSPLISHTRLSPNHLGLRKHKIDTVTVHCVVGQCSVEALGALFAQKGKWSSNYGIGTDGRIGLYVEEKNHSLCSSSYSNDDRAITIEVASDTTYPYKVTDRAYESLIKLLADICKRNGIAELKWKADKNLIGQVDKQNMTVHRWFANKACPGEYLYSRHGEIAKRVNELLGTFKPLKRISSPLEIVEVKDYRVRINANQLFIRVTPSAKQTIGVVERDEIYDVAKIQNGWGYLPRMSGWIDLKHTVKA